MALTTHGVANDVIGPSQFSEMMTEQAPARVRVADSAALRPTWDAGRVAISPGSLHACGVRVSSTATEYVSVPAPVSGSREYVIALRIRWSGEPKAELVAIGGGTGRVSVGRSGAFTPSRINWIPGVAYDAILGRVVRTATGASIYDVRCWGGNGGPLRTTASGMSDPYYIDARTGTYIETDRGESTKRLDDDNLWRNLSTDSNPWRTWIPMMRYYGTNVPDGTSGGSVCGMGNGSSVSARYRIVDGMLDGYIYIRAGATGATMGTGPVTIDLPQPCANWQTDTWSMGHFFNHGYGGDGNYDWPAQMLIKNGWTRGMLWVPRRIDDLRFSPYQAQDAAVGGVGTGIPFIANGFTVGDWTFHINYPVDM